MTIEIVIDNPGIMGPGDIIAGKVICTFYSEEHIRGIKCKFRAKEIAHLNQNGANRKVGLSGKHTILSANNIFMEEANVRPGKYEYEFAYALPPADIPSSYTNQFASVQYYIEALVDRPYASDYKTRVSLHVVSPTSLVYEPNMLSLSNQAEKTVGSLCCVSGPLALDVILEKNVYLLGETINFKVELVNNLNIEVEMLQVQLMRSVEFMAVKPTAYYRYNKDILDTVNKSGVNSKYRKTYDLSLKIPEHTTIHNFSKCFLFEQKFAIIATAFLPTFHSNLVLETIIKVCNSISETSMETEQSTIHTVPTINFVPVGEAPPVETEQPPPPYEDVIKQRIS